MRLLSVSVRTGADTVRLVAEAESGSPSRVFELYFEYPIAFAPFVSPAADSFAAAMLIPAMRRGEPLHITPPLSPRLLFHLPRIRDIIHTWHPELTRSAIHATPGPVDPAPPPKPRRHVLLRRHRLVLHAPQVPPARTAPRAAHPRRLHARPREAARLHERGRSRPGARAADRRPKEGLRALILNSPFRSTLPVIVDARRRIHDFRTGRKGNPR